MFVDLGFHLLVEKKKSCAKVRKPSVRVLWCDPNPRVYCLRFWQLESISCVVMFCGIGNLPRVSWFVRKPN